MGKIMVNYGKTIGKPMGKIMLNYGKTIGKTHGENNG